MIKKQKNLKMIQIFDPEKEAYKQILKDIVEIGKREIKIRESTPYFWAKRVLEEWDEKHEKSHQDGKRKD